MVKDSLLYRFIQYFKHIYKYSALKVCGGGMASWYHSSGTFRLLSSYAGNRSHAQQSVFFRKMSKAAAFFSRGADRLHKPLVDQIRNSASAAIAAGAAEEFRTRTCLVLSWLFVCCSAGYLAMMAFSWLRNFKTGSIIFPAASAVIALLLFAAKGKFNIEGSWKEIFDRSAIARTVKALIMPSRDWETDTAKQQTIQRRSLMASVPKPAIKAAYVLIAIIGVLAGAAGYHFSLKMLIAAAAAVIVGLLVISDYQRVVYIAAMYVFLDFVFRQAVSSSFLASYWDELLLIAAVLIMVYKWLVYRKEKAYSPTPLDIPLFFFFGIGIFLLIVAAPDMRIGFEGLRADIEYMLWFFIAVQLLRTKDGGVRLLVLMALTGVVLAFHGLYQYAVGTPMPAGWVDTAENGVRTRAFSIVASPNILGSLMVLLIPLALSFAFAEKKAFKRIIYFCAATAMVLCLVVTFSRSAWLGFSISMLVFFLMKDKRKFLPLLILIAAFLILLPPVYDRLAYLLSGDYIESSVRGGRLQRWPIGLKMLSENPLFGVGLGQFGGAVAENNNIPGTFYMDNYFLKTAVEMGIVGLSAFVILIYNTVIWSYRSIRNTDGTLERQLVQGIFASICGLVVPNFFENVFEVPMMVTYFWILAATAMFFANSKLYNSTPE